MSTPVDASAFSKDNPFPALLTENRMLTRPGSAKETRHFVVSLAGSGLHYKAGDSLGVFPSNRTEDVAEIIQRLGATGDELERQVVRFSDSEPTGEKKIMLVGTHARLGFRFVWRSVYCLAYPRS